MQRGLIDESGNCHDAHCHVVIGGVVESAIVIMGEMAFRYGENNAIFLNSKLLPHSRKTHAE